MSNRRDFLKKAALTGLVTSMVPTWVSAKNVDAPLNKNKKRALRIAHITDVHILDRSNAEMCFARCCGKSMR